MTTTAKGVTPEMVEAGAKACRDITFNALTMDECRDAVRAVLEAALSVSSGGLAVKALRQVVFDALDLSDELRNECTDAVVAALTALDRTTLPAAEGMVLVPKTPTPEMLAAWYRYKNGHHWHDEPPPRDTSDYGAYAAMLAAAPKGAL